MEKKNRKFSLGQKVLFQEKEYEICQIDLIANIYAIAKLDAEHKISVHWEERIRNGDMITNNKKIFLWVKEKDITLVEPPKESLLEEARRRYPKGTEYYCAHLTTNYKCIVSDPGKFFISAGDIYESSGDTAKNGHGCNECIYFNGKWAEIVSTPEKESSEFLTELGDEWYSLVGYNLLNKNGNVETIVRHNKTGGCKTDVGNHYDLHNIGTPYNMTNKLVKVYAEKPVVESTEEFQIGKWYQNKNISKLFIKPTSIDGEYLTANVIWGTGRYQEKNTSSGEKITNWNLLDDLSIIQEFLPDGHPDKVVIEKTPKQKSLVGRYLKALVDSPNFAGCYKKGDYIKIKIDNGSGSVSCARNMGFGNSSYDWNLSKVKLMPEGFHPDDVEPDSEQSLEEKYVAELAEVERLFPEGTGGKFKGTKTKRRGDLRIFKTEVTVPEDIRVASKNGHGILWSKINGYATPNTTPKLKVGQWVKIIDKPEGGRPDHWCPDGEMDKYFGQWVQIESLAESLDYYAFSVQNTEDEHDHWYFKNSDYTKVRDNKPELMKSWLDVQQECHRLQYQHALLMHERESLMRDSIPAFTQPLTPQESYKPCESKEDIVSSHLILLDVKPVRVSKQFK